MHTALPDPVYQPEFYDSVTTKRAMAWVVDTIITALICLIILPFTGFLALFFLPLLYLVVGFAYRVVTISGGSATWGMRIMAIELRDFTGARLSVGGAFLHTLGYTISMGMVLVQIASIALMMVSDRGQGLTDHVLGTVMLNRRA